MIWKVRYQVAGGHVHCALFSAPGVGRTYAKCGDLVVRVEEFPQFKILMSKATFEEAT